MVWQYNSYKDREMVKKNVEGTDTREGEMGAWKNYDNALLMDNYVEVYMKKQYNKKNMMDMGVNIIECLVMCFTVAEWAL